MPEKMFFNITAAWGLMWQEQPSNWHLPSSRCTARVMVITETEPQKSNNWMSRTGSHKTDNFLKYSCRVREIFCAKPNTVGWAFVPQMQTHLSETRLMTILKLSARGTATSSNCRSDNRLGGARWRSSLVTMQASTTLDTNIPMTTFTSPTN